MKKFAIFTLLCAALVISAGAGLTLEDIRVQYPAVYEDFKAQGNPNGVWSTKYVKEYNRLATNEKTLTGPLTSGAGLTLEDVRVRYPHSYEKIKAQALENPDRLWSIEEIENMYHD